MDNKKCQCICEARVSRTRVDEAENNQRKQKNGKYCLSLENREENKTKSEQPKNEDA